MSFDLNIFGPLPVVSTESAPGLALCMLIHVIAVIDLFHSSVLYNPSLRPTLTLNESLQVNSIYNNL